MKKQFLITFALLLTAMLSACGQQATQTSLEPATPTVAIVLPTETTAPANTSAPVSTDTVVAVTDTPAVTTGVSFMNDVMPILENQCTKCHGGEETKKGLDMTTYEGLMAGSFNGVVVKPGNAADSFLVQQINNGKMPKRAAKLSPEEIQIITDWINAGAINN